MEKNDFDRQKCVPYFQTYRDCKGKWVRHDIRLSLVCKEHASSCKLERTIGGLGVLEALFNTDSPFTFAATTSFDIGIPCAMFMKFEEFLDTGV
jgi:hypothetical protein